MTHPAPFNLGETPLLNGTTLIEASAGTGKTFTIAGLFLRLILERDYSVREILVVTFTEAAIEELRDRIRRRLVEAAAAFATGSTDDPVLKAILRPHQSASVAMQARLDRAIGGFDETPIYTIHGFCQRTLRDRAFESGRLFDTELITDDSDLLQQVAEDFWRLRFYRAEPLPVQVLLHHDLAPESFLPLLRKCLSHPTLQILSRVNGQPSLGLLDRMQSAFHEATDLWSTERDHIRACLGDLGWAKGEHGKSDVFETHWRLLEQCFDPDQRTPDALGALPFFSAETLRENTRKSSATPAHAFFQRCAVVLRLMEDFLTALRIEFVDYAKAEVPRRKQQLKVQSFDDLLNGLRDALARPGGSDLAREVRHRYRAALIDEFQDTDPVQYEIFRTLFHRPDGTLFLIGDPKQAIYGFRGADIFTYLDAAAAAGRAYTLGCNFRSESGLVQAVNTLFSQASQPFFFEDIRFQPVAAGEHADAAPLVEADGRRAPFHLWFMPREPDQKTISVEKANELLPELVADEIARLLNSGARLGDRPLSPRDFAVLVPLNRQATLMQETLRRRNIPSVLHTEESVFASHEARELHRVLQGIAQPAREDWVRAALATDLLGCDAASLDALSRNESGWQEWMEQFAIWRHSWEEDGFTAMFRGWLQGAAIRERLLRFRDGERRLTNVLHLGEAMHQACLERRLSATGLVRWLGEQIVSLDRKREEHQLRLERDDEAVKLVTIHKSKGLEYPIVFCPFSWKNRGQKNGAEPVDFHIRRSTLARAAGTSPSSDPIAGSTRHYCDLGSDQLAEHRELSEQERLAEELRLLYVALTRARNRCYFVWGAFRGAESSAGAWLLHPTPSPTDHPREDVTRRFSGLSDANLRGELEALAARSPDSTGRATMVVQTPPPATGECYRPPTPGTQELKARSFDVPLTRDWRIFSFSNVAASRTDEAPDYDSADTGAVTEVPDAIAEPSGIFAFPRGTQAGTCLHKIFEGLDFATVTPENLRPKVDLTLAAHGFAPGEFGEAVAQMVQRAISMPLELRQPEFCLTRVPGGSLLHELEFYLPVHALTPALLHSSFADAKSSAELLSQLARLEFQPSGGFLKGFIDLVFQYRGRFYLLDWKSNWLGNRVEDYGPEAMRREMMEHLYPLQYQLYCVALHRFLQQRLPGYDYEQHFGGVRYLFLRGLDPARPEFGVFHDRPSAEAIERLSARLET